MTGICVAFPFVAVLEFLFQSVLQTLLFLPFVPSILHHVCVPKFLPCCAIYPDLLRLFHIYKMFLEGGTPHFIAKHPTAEDIPTPGGKEVWSQTTVKAILTNEKYKGDALLQKSYTTDYLTKKKK